MNKPKMAFMCKNSDIFKKIYINLDKRKKKKKQDYK